MIWEGVFIAAGIYTSFQERNSNIF